MVPLAGALALFTAPARNARPIALLFNALAALDALALWQHFDIRTAGLQLVERHTWIPAVGAEYLVGIDGLSLLLVLLTSLIIPFAFLAQRMERGFCALMLIMQSALYGTFTAQNFVLWFLFYEMSLIPSSEFIWPGARSILPRLLVWAKTDCLAVSSPGSLLPESSLDSRSKCRCSHFTPGCPTRMKARRPESRWC